MLSYSIEEIKEKVTPIAERYGIDSLTLFGSYARGDADENSDLDFYVGKGSFGSLFEHSSFILDLEDTFGCRVDVVVLSAIRNQDFYNEITKEGVQLYERN